MSDTLNEPGYSNPKGPARQLKWWLPVSVAIIAAFVIGMFGGTLVAPLLGVLWGSQKEAGLEEAGNVERRADRLAGEKPIAMEPTIKIDQAPPGPVIIEQQEVPDKREEERRLLAYDSPLTPAVIEVSELVRSRSKQLNRQVAAGNAQNADDNGKGALLEMSNRDPLEALADDRELRNNHALKATKADPSFLADQKTGRNNTAGAQSRYILARGSVIPAILRSAIDSELPGMVRAQVTRDVFDTVTGNHILIPRGSSLTGVYGQQGSGRARRMFVSWDELRFPDGTRTDLNDFTALGADGASGLKGRRSISGFFEALGAMVLFDLAGNASAIFTSGRTRSQQGELSQLLETALGNSMSRVSGNYVGSLLNRQPRFHVKAGSFANVIVGQDLLLPATGSRSFHNNWGRDG